jgi:hypothetical protein
MTALALLFFAFIAVIGIAAFAFWIWMLVDCVTNASIAGPEKVVWLLIILFTHFIGALIYFFVRRSRGI